LARCLTGLRVVAGNDQDTLMMERLVFFFSSILLLAVEKLEIGSSW
jgi:hypothetical protein